MRDVHEDADAAAPPLIDTRSTTGCPAAGQLRAALRELHSNIATYTPTMRSVLFHMNVIVELEYAKGGTAATSWTKLWKELSRRGYDTANRGLRNIDYTNKCYTVVLELMCQLDGGIRREVVKLSKHYPTLDPTKDLDTLSDHAVVMRGDVVEIFLAACQGVGPFHPAPCSPPGSYRNLPFTFTCIVQACRCYHPIEGCCPAGTVCYRQEGSDRNQVVCPQTHAFRRAWGSSWKSKAALMATLVNLMHPRA